jgi:hypothetical protein
MSTGERSRDASSLLYHTAFYHPLLRREEQLPALIVTSDPLDPGRAAGLILLSGRPSGRSREGLAVSSWRRKRSAFNVCLP